MLAALIDERGQIQVPGFYDDVVPLTDSRASASSPRCRSTRQSSCSKLGVDRRCGRRRLHHAGTPLGPADVRHQRPVERLPGRRGQDGAARRGRRQVQLPPGAQPGSRARSPPRCEKQLARAVPARHPDGADRPARRAGRASCRWTVPYVAAAPGPSKHGFGRAPVFIREGGSIPIVTTFHDQLGADTLLLGWGQDDDNTHSPNEKFSLADFHRGIKASATCGSDLGEDEASPNVNRTRRTNRPSIPRSQSHHARSQIHRRKRRPGRSRTAAAAASQADVARFVELEAHAASQADRGRGAQSPGQRGHQVDRQGQGRRRARSPQGRRPRAPRADAAPRRPSSTNLPAEADAIHRAIPNLSHPDAPVGVRRSSRTWNCAAASTTPPKFDFQPLDHVDAGREARPDRLRRRGARSPATASTSSRTKPCCWNWPCSGTPSTC